MVVFTIPEQFHEAKAKQLPPHVHVFCTVISDQIVPSDFFPWKTSCQVLITNTFSMDALCAFCNDVGSKE